MVFKWSLEVSFGREKEGGQGRAGTVDEMAWVTCMVHLHLFNHVQFQEQILRGGTLLGACMVCMHLSVLFSSKSPSVVFGFVCPNVRTNGRNVVLN